MSAREPVEVQGSVRASVYLIRRNRDFRRLYAASLISLGGDWFLLVALFGLVLHFTDSALAVALVLAVEDLMYFLLSPVAGVLADRIDRRRSMVGADLARAFLCLGFLVIRTASLVWLSFVLLAVMASFSAVFEPASAAALPNMVEEEDLATANALTGSLWGTMLAVGAALGGIGPLSSAGTPRSSWMRCPSLPLRGSSGGSADRSPSSGWQRTMPASGRRRWRPSGTHGRIIECSLCSP